MFFFFLDFYFFQFSKCVHLGKKCIIKKTDNQSSFHLYSMTE